LDTYIITGMDKADYAASVIGIDRGDNMGSIFGID
jgi:hypothetical protein